MYCFQYTWNDYDEISDQLFFGAVVEVFKDVFEKYAAI
jgi:hypothetical protein